MHHSDSQKAGSKRAWRGAYWQDNKTLIAWTSVFLDKNYETNYEIGDRAQLTSFDTSFDTRAINEGSLSNSCSVLCRMSFSGILAKIISPLLLNL